MCEQAERIAVCPMLWGHRTEKTFGLYAHCAYSPPLYARARRAPARLRKVEAAAEECAQRELARARAPRARRQAGRHRARRAHGAAVRVHLHHVLARIRARRQHCQQQDLPHETGSGRIRRSKQGSCGAI